MDRILSDKDKHARENLRRLYDTCTNEKEGYLEECNLLAQELRIRAPDVSKRAT